MKLKTFLTQTRWLVTIIMLLSLGIGNAWGYTGLFSAYTKSTLIDGYYVIGASTSASNKNYCAGTTVSNGRLTGQALSTSNPSDNYVWIIEETSSGWTFNSVGSSTMYIKQTSTSSGKGLAVGTTIGYFTLDGYNSSSPVGFKFSSKDQNSNQYFKFNNSNKWFSNYKSGYETSMSPVTLYRDGTKFRAKTTQPTSGSFTASATGATWDDTKKHLSWMSSGTTITLTATPPSGKAVSAWTVTKATGGTVTVTNNQFTMPADQVTISVTWKDAGPACTALAQPTVTTAANNGSITASTATVSCSAGITSLGSDGCSISSYGFVVGTSSNPKIGESGVTQYEVGTTYTTTGTSFSKTLTGLSESTTYYVCSYATNGKGTAYGAETSFTTPEATRNTITLSTGTGSVSGGGWSGSTGTYTQKQASVGASITLPAATPSSACTALGWTFAGWKEGSAQGETTSAPTLVAAETSVTPEADVTYYAVYKLVEGEPGATVGTTLWSEDFGYSTPLASNTPNSPSASTTYGGASVTYSYTNGETDTKLWNENTAGGAAAPEILIGKSNGAFTITGIPSGSASTATLTFVSNHASYIEPSTNSAKITVSGSSSSYTLTFAADAPNAFNLVLTNTNSSNCRVDDINLVVATAGSSGTTTWTSSPACEGTATVTYNTNGATSGTAPTDSNSPYDLGSSVTVLGNTGNLTKAGLDFGGWNTAADGSGTTYHPGATFTIKSNTTLYAKWVTLRTVTLIDNGHSTNVYVADGEAYSLPDEGESTCPDITFLGWYTDTGSGDYHTNHLSGTSTQPTYDAGGTSKTISADVTFVAVYGTLSEGVATTYTKINSLAALTTGDYLIAGISSWCMSNSVTSSSYMEEVSMSSNLSSGVITNSSNNNIIWHITKTGDNYTLYNAAVSKYLALSTTSPLVQTEAHNFTATYSSGSFIFASTTVSGYQLAYSSYFKSLTSQNSVILLYKRDVTMGNFTSKPYCCHEPATALSIGTDASTLVSSGSAAITLTGGNGKNITWSCVDEASANCNGQLSSTSNSGCTFTVSSPVAATKTYTITATQADDDDDADNVICGATVTVNITVKAQWTITYKTKDEGTASTYSTATVTDGNTYTLPDISDEYSCEDGWSFAGWSTSESATSVEESAGETVTASANTTWWAVWRSASAGTETRDKYEKVSDAATLAADQQFVLAYNNASGCAALATTSGGSGYLDKVYVTLATDETYLTYPSSTTTVEVLTLKGSSEAWKFYSAAKSQWLAMNASGSVSWASTEGEASTFTISISSGEASINCIGAIDYYFQYNSSSPRYKGYKSSSNQNNATLYRKNGTIEVDVAVDATYVVNNTHCANGAMIRVADNPWITAANGQKVKGLITVTAKNFDEGQTLAVSSNNAKFAASLAETEVPSGASGLTTNLIVEYTPTSADVRESATITLTAGDVTKTITVHGRSLPDEFAIITKKTVWYALPANMSGANQYDGIEVTVDDADAPILIPAAPYTVVYSLQSVANSEYATNGDKVRFVGNDGKCLWANSSSGATTIQDWAVVANATSGQYEWLLTTTDGNAYTIANPAHPNHPSRTLGYGAQFGMYVGEYTFYIVPIGCSGLPGNVRVEARRVDATFAWESTATSMQITITPSGGGASINKTFSGSPAFVTGLTQQTDYTFTLLPDGETDCQYEGEFTTTGPTVDVIDWEENAAIIQVDKDGSLNPLIIISGEHEEGLEGGVEATELFFAKYFEGAGSMKLLSIFNGTRNAIDLTNYKIYMKCVSNTNNTFSSGSDKEYPLKALGSINAGQEIIFFTPPLASESDLSDCSTAFLTAMAAKSDADENPRWIKCDGETEYNGTTFKKFDFSGNDPLLLYNGSTIIDVFGAKDAPPSNSSKDCRNQDLGWWGRAKNIDKGKKTDDPEFDYLWEASSNSPSTHEDSVAILNGFGINLDDDTIDICTARCILFRGKVANGSTAVGNNTSTFYTFTTATEWNGRTVCMSSSMQTAAGVTNDSKGTCNSYQDLGKFDYNSYYKEYSQIGEDSYLDDYTHDADRHTYTIPITNMKQYACLNLKFQLTNPSDRNDVLTEQIQQVPIVVASSSATTADIFSKVIPSETNPYPNELYEASANRCAECNVIILDGATLTKAADGTTHDVNAVRNIKIYPGGKLVVPSNTNYSVNALIMRREEDEVSEANIQGTLNIAETKGVYLDLKIDPTNWHYVALPFDCNIDDVTFSSGIPAELGVEWLCARYDGEYRAANRTGGWTDMKPGDVLKKGHGYIVSIPGDGLVQRELRFPMAKEVINQELSNKTISDLHAWGGDDDELRPNHKGWNLIGNPYLVTYNNTSGSGTITTSPLMVGTLIHDNTVTPWDGTWIHDPSSVTSNLRYIVRPINNGWSGYEQTTINNMEPFTAYFIQMGGNTPSANQSVTFNAARAKRSIVRRAPAEYEEDDQHPVWYGIDLVSGNHDVDRTAILVSNQFTDNFDMMDDLIKQRGSYYQYYPYPVIASRNKEGEMAFNALPDSSAAITGVPLNYFAASAGTYTIRTDSRYDLEEVKSAILYDKVTNTRTDLLENDYMFETVKGDNTDRFTLFVRVERKKAPEVATGCDNLLDGQLSLIAIDKTLVLSGLTEDADIYVYDMSGKLVRGERAAGNGVWRATVPSQGVYFVRVNGISGQQTLRTIVK